jgi:signal transduction histidine kinase
VPAGLGADEAGAAVDALLGNVFGHTPDGTAYRITLVVDDARAGATTATATSTVAPTTHASADASSAAPGPHRGPREDGGLGRVARLHVDDAGPGIADPAAVLARGHSSARSTGLGLDIARRATEAAGGEITIGRSPLGGTRVTLTFPAPDPG